MNSGRNKRNHVAVMDRIYQEPVWHLSQKVEIKFAVKRTLIHMTSGNNVLKFLTLLNESGLRHSSINTAHSSLSSLDCGSKCPVGLLFVGSREGPTFQDQHNLVL